MDQILHAREHLPVYDVAGPRDAFPIVLVHGAAATRKMWLPQLEALSEEFRVIALDLPGLGPLREPPFQLQAAVQAVMESPRQHTHNRALIVGLSLGGYVAMVCANAHPQEIAGLVLSGCCLDYRELASHDFPAMLHSFPGPALILNVENDKPNRKREAALLNATQDGQLEIIAQAGHVCNLDQPEAFTQQVRTFAKRLKTATSN